MPGTKAVTVDLEVEIMRVLEAALPGTQIYFLTHLRDNLIQLLNQKNNA
jgi:hypothetical protein